MGLFNFLAMGSSLMGLVGRRAHRSIPLESEVPNFGLQPGVAERLRDVLEVRNQEDPFSRRNHVQERDIRERLHQHQGPRVRSTFKPQQVEPDLAEAAEDQLVAPAAGQQPARQVARQSLEPEVDPSSRSVEEPKVGGAGSLWVRKLKIARRVVARPPVDRGKRQPKQPSVIRGADGARKRRSPRGVAGQM
jgi:hypothetical protein